MADGILNPIEQLEAEFDFDVYTKQEVDALLDEKADKSDTYTKTETDALLDEKADADAVYTKTETDTLLSAKADKSTTLAGYGITDAYTKTQTDNLLNGKADADSVYTKTEINTKIPNTVGSATKPTYVNGGVITECTYELNKTVPANAVFTDTTYSAGNGLNLSGTSFSAKAGVNVTVDGNGINVNGNGAVASADSGLVSGGTAYTELRPTLDGTWVKNAQTTAINLQKLEGGIEYLYAILSKQYDQLKKYINGNYYDYDTDTDSKYTKSVPQGAMPYASLDSIGGKTLVWNQQFQSSYYRTGSVAGGAFTLTKTNDDKSLRIVGGSASVTYIWVASGGTLIAGHKYYIGGFQYDSSMISYVRIQEGINHYFNDESIVFTATGGTLTYYFQTIANASADFTWTIQVSDLTLMYGAGNEPSTVAEFQQTFPAQYYPYNAGTLLSAGVTEVVSKKADTTEIATYPIPAEIRNLEGYGWSAGSVYNYVDFERKVFVKNVERADLGTQSWSYFSQYGGVFTANFGYPDSTKSMINNPSGIICPRYVFKGVYSSLTDMSCGYIYYKNIAVKDDSFNGDKAAFKTAMSGVYAYYPLATPIETDISAYITDDNLIEVEAGGSLTFPNSNGTDYQIPVPSAETYMVDLQASL